MTAFVDVDGAGGGASKARPRYINGLMKTARRRNQEHEVVHERKVMREQAMDLNPEYDGKETFVTSSYRRKMEERERWAREEEERTRREEEADAKMKGGNATAMGNFMFGIVGRNLLMEGGVDRRGIGDGCEKDELTDRRKVEQNSEGDHLNNIDANDDDRGTDDPGDACRERYSDRRGDVVRGGDNDTGVPREQESSTSTDRERVRRMPPSSSSFVHAADSAIIVADEARTVQREEDEGGAKNGKLPRRRVLAERAKKIRDARVRYFKRMGGMEGSGNATMAM